MHGDAIKGSILYGSSPTKLIETFTGAIGRPPVLPTWIISGAVVGMQGGTDSVRRVWDKLKSYDVPIRAFWLQVSRTTHFSSLYCQLWSFVICEHIVIKSWLSLLPT